MKNEKNSYILVFKSYNESTLLYNILLKKGCKIELISTPCSLSRGCSQSIEFTLEAARIIKEEAKANKITIRGIYKINENGNNINYIPI